MSGSYISAYLSRSCTSHVYTKIHCFIDIYFIETKTRQISKTIAKFWLIWGHRWPMNIWTRVGNDEAIEWLRHLFKYRKRVSLLDRRSTLRTSRYMYTFLDWIASRALFHLFSVHHKPAQRLRRSREITNNYWSLVSQLYRTCKGWWPFL
jgi:hypothetical protein